MLQKLRHHAPEDDRPGRPPTSASACSAAWSGAARAVAGSAAPSTAGRTIQERRRRLPRQTSNRYSGQRIVDRPPSSPSPAASLPGEAGPEAICPSSAAAAATLGVAAGGGSILIGTNAPDVRRAAVERPGSPGRVELTRHMAEFWRSACRVGVAWAPATAMNMPVEITENAAGAEFPPAGDALPGNAGGRIRYTRATSALWDNVVALYHRWNGTYAGFRVVHRQQLDQWPRPKPGRPAMTRCWHGIGKGHQLQRVRRRGRRAPAVGLPSAPSSNRWPVRHSSHCQYPPSGMPTGPSIQLADASLSCRQYLGSRPAGISKAARCRLTPGNARALSSWRFLSGVGLTEINKRALITAVSVRPSPLPSIRQLRHLYPAARSIRVRWQSCGGCYFHFILPASILTSGSSISGRCSAVRRPEIVRLFNHEARSCNPSTGNLPAHRSLHRARRCLTSHPPDLTMSNGRLYERRSYDFTGYSADTSMSPGSLTSTASPTWKRIGYDEIASGVFVRPGCLFATTWNSPIEDEAIVSVRSGGDSS